MRHPLSTYRLQLVPGQLGFDEAAELVGYLADLGVTHLYLSPVLAARQGSTHGYDVADPALVAPALGGEEGLRRLAAAAAERGLGIVVDVVPNHLGTGPDNPLWEALLAEGQAGPAGAVFDVDWHHPLPGAQGKVILPVLGRQYGEAVVDGELYVAEEDGETRLRYHDHSFPLSPESLEVLSRSATLASLWGEPGVAETWGRLHGLLESQHYRLVHWRAGHALVNYRRFFAVDELAGVRVEDPDVFERTHATVLRLVEEGVVQGLRVDHPDGLRDPRRYLERLAERAGGAWTVVEKILAAGEELPDWPVAGTTGYEFAISALGLYVDPDSEPLLDQLDAAFGAPDVRYGALVAESKAEVLDRDLAADLRRLGRRLWAITQEHPTVRDVDDVTCTELVRRTLVAMDVYRTYVDPETGESTGADRDRVTAAVDAVEAGGADHGLCRFLVRLLCGAAGSSPAELDFVARFQQLSGAVMAKGVEDTAFYRHHRLVAVNEVGGDPSALGGTVEEFHAANSRRAERHPSGMLTTATHDTKRGEDVRLRIAALSELPERWNELARRWRDAHRPLSPDPQTEHLLYQTLVGVWPLSDPARLHAYAVKAVREAGLRSSWTDPDEELETELARFVDGLLADRGFTEELDGLVGEVQEIATVSSLAQTLLRCTSPGVPDTYQGTELWEDSLVDPDNRRPVDFDRRRAALAELDGGADPAELWAQRGDGRVKLWVLSRSLRARRDLPAAAFGDYVPLETTGRWADRLVAFARTAGGEAFVVLAPRLPGAVLADGGWHDTAVRVPPGLAGPYRDVLAERDHDLGAQVRAADVLAPLPVALLTAH